MDLAHAVGLAMTNLIESGAVEKAIEKQLQQTFESVLRDQLSQYGDFGKQLTAAIKGSLSLHGNLDLPAYNATILRIVRAQVEARTNAVIQQQVATHLGQLLEPAPESITLSRLVAAYVDYVKRDGRSGCHCDGSGEVTVHVLEDDFGYQRIYLDPEARTPKKDCQISISVSDKGHVYWLHFRNRDVERELFAGPFYDFERSLFQMRAAGTRIVFDCADHDLDKSFNRD